MTQPTDLEALAAKAVHELFPDEPDWTGTYKSHFHVALTALRTIAQDAEPVALVRFTHGGYGAELAQHIAYGLPEGEHWLYAHPSPAPQADGEDKQALDWLAANASCELHWHSMFYGDDDDTTSEWRVSMMHGSMNHREWTVIGRGATPRAAILAALSLDAPQERRA